MAIKRWTEFHRTPVDAVHQVLLDYAQMATHSLHLDVYGFTDADLGDILIAKHQAGLEVGVVADKTQSAGKAQKALLQRLVDAGVLVTIATSPTGAINHVKYIIIDGILGATANQSYAILGSLNFSASGERQENFFFAINDAVIVADLLQQYQETQAYGATHCPQLRPQAASRPPEDPEGVDDSTPSDA